MNETVICRLCLDVVPMGYTILKENIQSIIKNLTSIDVTSNDDLPKLSCSKCLLNLYFIESVQNLISKSDERLRSILSRNGNLDELLQATPIVSVNDNQTGVLNCIQSKAETCSPVISEMKIPLNSQICENVQIKEENFSSETSNIEINETLVLDVNNIPHINEKTSNRVATTVTSTSDNKSVNSKETTTPMDDLDENRIIYRIDKNLYHCRVCKEDFSGKKLYAVHKGKHTKKTCEICHATIRQDNFSKHVMNHNSGQQICDICGSIHKSKEGLRNHLLHFHNEKREPFTCEECGRSFKRRYKLTHHKRNVHRGFRAHECEHCGKRFFEQPTLKKHIKLIHLKLKEHHCNYCQKDYSSRYALKVHMRQHTEETPYVCEICCDGFRQLVSLKTHMAKHQKVEEDIGEIST